MVVTNTRIPRQIMLEWDDIDNKWYDIFSCHTFTDIYECRQYYHDTYGANVYVTTSMPIATRKRNDPQLYTTRRAPSKFKRVNRYANLQRVEQKNN